MTQYLQSYQKTMTDRIAGASPETLMVMLYEGMLTRIKQARERFEANQRIPAKSSVMRAMRIADALMEHLNLEDGGETAKNLEQLYYFVISELAEANRVEQPAPHLDNALRTLEPLYEAWKGLAAKGSSATAPAK